MDKKQKTIMHIKEYHANIRTEMGISVYVRFPLLRIGHSRMGERII
jgi:hypothetical protein